MLDEALQKLSDNVIVFPNKKLNGPATSVEELKNIIVANKTEVVDCFVEELSREVLRIISEHGYHLNNGKDIAFLIIMLKAIILRYEKIDHPIQRLIDDCIQDIIDDNNDEGE